MSDLQNIEELNIRPKTSIYRSFSRYNYKLWYALAEFVDNSTASFYANKSSMNFYHINNISIKIDFDEENNILTIKDDAHGMNIQDFKRALLLDARPEDRTGRNEFGMGLKTAACWFGTKWSVESTELGSPIKYKATIDVNELEKTEKEYIPIIKTPANSQEHYTIITIENLNRKPVGAKTVSKIKTFLASLYRKDINDNNIKIYFNNELITFKPYKFMVLNGNEYRKNLDFHFTFNNIEHHVIGFVGILADCDSSYKKAGLALFRRNRGVIGAQGEYYKPSEIYKQPQSYISLRLFGELNLDDFEINQAKDGFVWDDGLEDCFIANLKAKIKDYIDIASNITKSKQSRKENFSDKNINEIETNVTKSFNDAYTETSEEKQRSQITIEPTGDYKKFTEDCDTINKKSDFNKEKNFKISTDRFGNHIEVKVTFTNNNDSIVSLNTDTNKVIINIDHPLFGKLREDRDFQTFLTKLSLSLFLAAKDTIQGTQDGEGKYAVENLCFNLNKRLKELGNKDE